MFGVYSIPHVVPHYDTSLNTNSRSGSPHKCMFGHKICFHTLFIKYTWPLSGLLLAAIDSCLLTCMDTHVRFTLYSVEIMSSISVMTINILHVYLATIVSSTCVQLIITEIKALLRCWYLGDVAWSKLHGPQHTSHHIHDCSYSHSFKHIRQGQ